jgi:sarcosine oxidase / L-pipecolate oxidase
MLMACRFLPNAGRYMLNILDGRSNGEEKDRAWGWKSAEELRKARGRREKKWELKELENTSSSLGRQSRL